MPLPHIFGALEHLARAESLRAVNGLTAHRSDRNGPETSNPAGAHLSVGPRRLAGEARVGEDPMGTAGAHETLALFRDSGDANRRSSVTERS